MNYKQNIRSSLTMKVFLSFILFLVIVLLSAVASPVSKSIQEVRKPLEWWQQTVVYQIYPRSFQDSDGDGVGDINGIISKLDYLLELGIGAVWISPIYESPMVDFGYDISNFTRIDPIFGTDDDFKRMAAEFKKRDMKLIMDMVPNHSSDLHDWFQKSIERIEPYTDYYVWRDANRTDADGNPVPPNNWVSLFGGSAWEWNEKRQQFYLHQFAKQQPDLNFDNIEVRNEILAVIKFWLDTGVEGFRVDAVPHLFEDKLMRDEPINPDRDPEARPDEWRYYQHVYTYNLPQVLDFLADMRRLMDVYSKADGIVRCMMVESGVPDKDLGAYYGTPERPIAHFPFNFHLQDVRPHQNASEVLGRINVWFDIMPEGEWATFLIANHDQPRLPTKFTEEGIDGGNMINLLLKGTAVSYYGEEIGMTDTFLTWEETVDPGACNTDPERYLLFTRDPARTPMQWNNSTSAGFSTNSTTWLPLNKNYTTVNVAAQEAAEESHIKIYRELVKLRQTEAWRYGSYEGKALNSDKVLGFSRIPPADSTENGFLVLANLSGEEATVDSTIFPRVPSSGIVRVRSTDFKNRSAYVGSNIDTRNVLLGARNSIVIEFTPI